MTFAEERLLLLLVLEPTFVFAGAREEQQTYPIVPQGEHTATRGIDHEWNARGTIEQESPEEYLLEEILGEDLHDIAGQRGIRGEENEVAA